MAIVATLDQRESRGRADEVARMARRLNAVVRHGLVLDFVRTAGDEMQGVVATGEGLAAVISCCLEEGGWWIGIGVGEVDQPLGRTARDSRGSAFWHAREALVRAHKRTRGPSGPIAVVGEPVDVAENLDAAICALAFIVTRRTARQRSAVAAARDAKGLIGVARRLGISISAASQLLRASGREEQHRLETLIARLAVAAL